MHDGEYLYDVSAKIIVADDEDYASRTSKIEQPFKSTAPKDYNYGQESYSKAFDIWVFAIALDAPIKNSDAVLEDLISEIFNNSSTESECPKRFSVHLRGSAKDGRIYSCKREQDPKEIKIGCSFEPISMRSHPRRFYCSGKNYHYLDRIVEQNRFSSNDSTNWR